MAKRNEIGAQFDGDSNVGSIKKFNKTNFEIWKFQMTILFHVKELMEIGEIIKNLETTIKEK
jgi:hypothetical protein